MHDSPSAAPVRRCGASFLPWNDRRRPLSTFALDQVWRLIPHLIYLRIDVQHGPEEVARELDVLYGRMNTPGDAMYGMPVVGTDMPGLVLRYREADGEYYVYVEDVAMKRLAGYTVFNRLIEVSRRADPYVRAPHSKYALGYQGRGLSTSIYEWALNAGLCLLSGARQSVGAHALWRSLARRYELGYVDLRRKRMTYLGDRVSESVLNDLHTRMFLLGRGWTREAFARATQMAGAG